MNRLTTAALIICAAYVAAIFAPWITIGGFISASLTQGEDAPFLIAAAVVTAVAFWRWPLRLITPILGLTSAAFMALEIANVASKLSEKSDTGNEIADAIVGAAAPSWGLYLGVIVSIALVVVSIMSFKLRRTLIKQRFEEQPEIAVEYVEHDEVSDGERDRREFYRTR